MNKSHLITKKIVAIIFVLVMASFYLTGCQCKHEYTTKITKEATCTSKGIKTSTCIKCGNEITETIPEIDHSWVKATCTSPKTCKYCHIEEGVALEHQWLSATCASPQRCKRCGKTEGIALEHTWVDATCTESRKCIVCAKKDGAPLGHTTLYGVCERCNTVQAELSDELIRCLEKIENADTYLYAAYSEIAISWSVRPTDLVNAMGYFSKAGNCISDASKVITGYVDFAEEKAILDKCASNASSVFYMTASNNENLAEKYIDLYNTIEADLTKCVESFTKKTTAISEALKKTN